MKFGHVMPIPDAVKVEILPRAPVYDVSTSLYVQVRVGTYYYSTVFAWINNAIIIQQRNNLI